MRSHEDILHVDAIHVVKYFGSNLHNILNPNMRDVCNWPEEVWCVVADYLTPGDLSLLHYAFPGRIPSIAAVRTAKDAISILMRTGTPRPPVIIGGNGVLYYSHFLPNINHKYGKELPKLSFLPFR